MDWDPTDWDHTDWDKVDWDRIGTAIKFGLGLNMDCDHWIGIKYRLGSTID